MVYLERIFIRAIVVGAGGGGAWPCLRKKLEFSHIKNNLVFLCVGQITAKSGCL